MAIIGVGVLVRRGVGVLVILGGVGVLVFLGVGVLVGAVQTDPEQR